MPRLPVGRVLSDTLQLVSRNYGVLARAYGVFIVAAGLIALAAGVLAQAALPPDAAAVDPEAFEEDPEFLAAFGLLAVAFLGLGLVGLVVHALGLGVGVVVTDAILRGERPSLGDAWSRLKPRAGNLVLTLVLAGAAFLGLSALAAFLGMESVRTGSPTLILILPVLVALGLFLAVLWLVAPAVSVFEGRSVTGNLGRASALTKGTRGLVLVLVLVLAGAYVAASGVTGLAGLAVVGPDPAVTPDVGEMVLLQALDVLVDFVILPFIAAALTIAYWSLAAPPRDPDAAGPEGASGDAGRAA